MTSFPADSFVVGDVVPSPNHDERQAGRSGGKSGLKSGGKSGSRSPDMIVLHYTGMPDGRSALDRLCSADSKVSAHYVVFEDGRTVQCVPEMRRAWHAGESYWAGETDINSCSIGIEIVNPGHDYGYPDFPLRQTAAVISLCRVLLSRYAIPPDRVLAHSDVAPTRKRDPGEKFPWGLLSESNIGHWVRPAPLTLDGQTYGPGDHGDNIRRFQRALKNYGYDIEDSGIFDDQTGAVVLAFQRHFRPEKIDGIVDASTLLTLRALLETRPSRSGSHARSHAGSHDGSDDGGLTNPDTGS